MVCPDEALEGVTETAATSARSIDEGGSRCSRAGARARRGKLSSRTLALAVALAFSSANGPTAGADEVRFGRHDVPTIFFISKSDDKNRVDYGIRLDADCAPVGNDAVFPYWRELENPPVRIHGINFLERIPYGISDQGLVRRFATGAEYSIRLRQLDRVVGVSLRKQTDGTCTATPRARVGGVTAILVSVFVKLTGPMSVAYIDIHGKDFNSGAPIDERVKR